MQLNKKTISIITSIIMIVSAFLPWYNFNFSGSINLGAYGSQSSSINSSITGMQSNNVVLILLLAAGGLILCFIKPIKYLPFIIGLLSIVVSVSYLLHWTGLPLTYNASFHTDAVQTSGGVSNGIGLYILLISSIVYTIVNFDNTILAAVGNTNTSQQTSTTGQVQPQSAPIKVSRKTIIALVVCAVIAVVGFGGYKYYDQNRVYKINSVDELCKEFDADNAGTIAKYKGHLIEFTGTFYQTTLIGSKDNPPDFLGVTNNNSDNRVHVQTGVDKGFLNTNSIIPEMGSNWFYNKNTNQIYDNSELFSDNEMLDNESKKRFRNQALLTNIKAAIEYFQNLKDPVIDSNVYGENYLENMLSGCDNDLKNAIITNNILIRSTDNQSDCIIDKVTIRGRLTSFEKAENGFGQAVISLAIDNMKIVNKERVFDFKKLPVLDYMSAQKVLTDKIKLAKSMIKPPVDTTVKTDTVKRI